MPVLVDYADVVAAQPASPTLQDTLASGDAPLVRQALRRSAAATQSQLAPIYKAITRALHQSAVAARLRGQESELQQLDVEGQRADAGMRVDEAVRNWVETLAPRPATKGAQLADAFAQAVAEAVQGHLSSGRATPVYRDGVLIGIKPRR